MEINEQQKGIKDFIEILKMRKWSFIVPLLLFFVASIVTAVLIPPTYRSTATILVEEQEIPREYVLSPVTGYAEQRIQQITQQILSSVKLVEIIRKFNLYQELRDRYTLEEIITKMREDIKVEPVSAEVGDRRTGRPATVTIAFRVSYEGRYPEVVQRVTNELVSLYLEQNLKTREEKIVGATRFIEEELNDVRGKLKTLDSRIAAYKEKHLHSLPELTQLNLQELERAERTLEQIDIQLRNLKERESALQTQLSSIPPDLADPDKQMLKELRAKLVSLSTRYSDEHPDVKKTKEQIEKLEEKLKSQGVDPIGGKPDNPAYINIASQISSVQSEMEELRKQREAVYQKMAEYRRRIQMSPKVEEGYRGLVAERNNLQAKYDDLMRKYLETKVALSLEKEQMGERFTLIDPPRLPEEPVKPNIPAIILIGIVLGIGSGVGTVSIKEHMDQSIRNPDVLSKLTGFSVLSTIPEIVTLDEILRSKRRNKIFIVSIAIGMVVLVLIFHFFIMDLDVFWARLTRRLGI
ncbi:MAG: Wzz/FepE/Etk N-terminal domain-containing protein [Deltaproteobacteria bacterium]|nr:Wzz/FepE/Etk N-terminal domain-containing protein [Deltaproteobacteria bacterium]